MGVTGMVCVDDDPSSLRHHPGQRDARAASFPSNEFSGDPLKM